MPVVLPFEMPEWPWYWPAHWIVYPFCHCLTENWTAVEPKFGSYKDFRSPSIPKKRYREDRVKYYSYRAVDPSWIGQEYYALQLISSTIDTIDAEPKTLRYLTPSQREISVAGYDEAAINATLIHSGCHWMGPPVYGSIHQLPVVISRAKATTIDSYPVADTEPQTTLPSTDALCTSEEPNDSQIIEQYPVHSPASGPEDMLNTPQPELYGNEDPSETQNMEHICVDPAAPSSNNTPDHPHLQLSIKTWTKQDNFATKERFIVGPDRRHHRGKRRVREKHLQKWGEKELGRGQKQRSKDLEHEILGYYPITSCRQFLSWEFKEPREFLYEPWDKSVETGSLWWGYDSEERLGSTQWDEDEDEDEDAWYEDEYYAPHWTERVDGVEVIHKVLDWRELACDYEGMAGYEDDTVSIGSEVIVLEQIEDGDADVDAMSDLAEVIVQEEWDVLSKTSSNESQGFVTVG